MPTPRVECRHCRKLVIAIDLFNHLNFKHPEALWTQNNKAEIEKALTRSCETHNIALRIDGETHYYSPYSNRLYSTVPRLLNSKNKILKHERSGLWIRGLERVVKGFSGNLKSAAAAAAAAPTPPEVFCPCKQILILIELLREQGAGAGGSAFELPKNLPGCVVDGNHIGAEDGGVGEDEAGAGEDD